LKPRIHILGGPGSGKSYIAAKLASHFHLLACDLDELFWSRAATGYGLRNDSTERDRQLANILGSDGWIIEGVYYQWLAPSFAAADLIIALTPSIWIRHWRVVKLFVLRRFGIVPAKRETVADLWRLLLWSHAYDSENLPNARRFLVERGHALIECRTYDEVLAAVKKLDRH